MLKSLVILASVIALTGLAQAEVLLPSQTQAPRCADGLVFDQPTQRCVTPDQRSN